MKPLSRTMFVSATTALFAIPFLVTTMSKASAEDWCRFNEHYIRSCGFASKEQCMDMASGRGGMCDPNPFPGKAAAHHPIAVSSHAEYMACRSMNLDCVGGGSGAYAYLPKSSKGAAHVAK